MTTRTASTTNTTSLRRRWLLSLLVWSLLALGWGWLAQERSLLWARLPASTVNRFVADQLPAAWPRLPSAPGLQAACAQPLSSAAFWLRSRLRAELAQCLSQPQGLLQGDAAQAAVGRYEGLIAQQQAAAQAWLAAYDSSAPSIRQALADDLARLQARSAAPFTPWPAGWATPSRAVRELVGPTSPPDQVASRLRTRLAASQAQVAAWAQSASNPGEHARDLALAYAGLQLVTDYGQVPAPSHLTSAPHSLADALEWQRRAHGYAERGFSLGRVHALLDALAASALVLCLVVWLRARCSPLTLALWGAAAWLLGVGALMLADVALTGDSALRYLVERQFIGFGVGDIWLPLMVHLPWPAAWGGGTVALWWPLLGVVMGQLLLGRLVDGQSARLLPVRLWLGSLAALGHDNRPRWRRWGRALLQPLLLLAAGVALVAFLGMPAAVSELLIALGCVGVASYLARQAPHANSGAGLQGYNLAVVGVALALAVGGALWRGDLGHALVAVLLAACFAWLFGWAWLRAVVALASLALLASLAMCLAAGTLVGPLAWLTQMLPPHAQDRMVSMFDPLHAASSDLARVHWLMDSAGLTGWGPGYVPWQGISQAGSQDGLPLQGPSDYVLALVTALWGRAGGVALMAAVMGVFAASAWLGLRTSLRAGMPPVVRWLAALGGMGCVVMAAKVFLSMGGVSAVLPLTGLPVGLLGYGPVTHLAALLYLSLALGTLRVVPLQTRRGVDVEPRASWGGAVSRRSLGFAMAGASALVALLVLGYQHLQAGVADLGPRHVSQVRLSLAQALAAALAPANAAQGAAPAPCPELDQAVQAWNHALANLNHPVRVKAGNQDQVTEHLQLQTDTLLAAYPVQGHRACRSLARTLGQMLATDLPRLVGRGQIAGHAQGPMAKAPSTADALAMDDKPRVVSARPLDYSTPNAWWGQPGCVWPAQALAALAPDAAQPGQACSGPGAWRIDDLNTPLLSDRWLHRDLAPQIFAALRQPAGNKLLNQHNVAVGPALGLTLSPTWQPRAQRLADCFTGQVRGADCADALPLDEAWRQRQFGQPDALRAGALGLVLAEVDTGRIVALAGSMSDCSRTRLTQVASPDAQGRIEAVHPGGRCASLPDRRSAWLGGQHPALWMVPPGSSLKPWSLVAGIDSGVVAAGDASQQYWKRILAESHERLPVQRTALAAGQRYIDMLSSLGYGQGHLELLWGSAGQPASPAPLRAKWLGEAYGGAQGLRATTMTLDQSEAIRAQRLQGVAVDRVHSHAEMTEFVAARRLADAAVGGGDLRINAMGLVDVWRSLDLRARGNTQAKGLHLLELPGQPQPHRSLDWFSPQAAQRALGMTSGVAASAWHGTAQGSCRVVFGRCHPEGLPGLSGKTGSADFLVDEDSPWVKPGQQLPAKVFGGVFTAQDGKRYAIAVMALRVREGQSRTLELTSSAPAEAAFTLMRQMGVKAF